MKRVLVFSAVIAVLGLVSCKEKGPLINTGGSVSSGDTTYTITPEASVSKKILVEEFTGAKCSNCPAAREKLASLAVQYPGKIIVMELHPKEHILGGPSSSKSKYDFRNQSVSDILGLYYGGGFTTGIPIAGIDRMVYMGSRLIDQDAWASIIGQKVTASSAVKLGLTNTYNAATAEGSLRIKVSYTKDVTAKQYISVAILEDSVVDIQDFISYKDTAYTFKHIFRGLATPASGAEFLGTFEKKEAGRVYEGNYKYTIKPDWKANHCHIVVFVHGNSGEDKDVLQAEEIAVKNP